MKLIGYILKRFIPLFLGSILFFSMVLLLVDLLMNLWSFISNQIPAKTVLYLMALYLPKTIWYAAPLGILFATSYTLSDFYTHNELTAIFASGVSLIKFTYPLLIFSLMLSFAMVLFEDKVVVPTYSKKTELQTSILNKEKSKNNDNIVILGDFGNIVYKADFYDDSVQRLYTLFLVFRNSEDKSLGAIIKADSAQWRKNSEDSEDGSWKLSNPIQYSYKNGELKIEAVDSKWTSRLTEPPETFRNNTINVETVSIKESKEYIEHLQRAGLPFAESLSLYYKKFSFSFIIFIVVFLSIALSGKTRKNVLLTSLASCISAAVLFYVTQMITMLLAKFGFISPFSGAWSPVFLFIILSTILLRFART